MEEEVSVDYRAKLKKTVEKVPGTIIGSLASMDGIALATYTEEKELDTSIIEAELGSIFGLLKKSVESMEAGKINNFVIVTEKYIFVTRAIGEEFYVALVLKGNAFSLGLARLEVKRLAKEFRKTLL